MLVHFLYDCHGQGLARPGPRQSQNSFQMSHLVQMEQAAWADTTISVASILSYILTATSNIVIDFKSLVVQNTKSNFSAISQQH